MEENITLTEIMMQEKEDEYYTRMRSDLETVLDFVERWNKQDMEKDVAISAERLSSLTQKP